jgi:titin
VNSVGSTIGGASASARNVISDNGTDGIRISGAASTGNQVLGNFIGTDTTGMVGFGNANWGINLDGASGNVVGGTAAGAGNLISWNGSGVQISLGLSNRVQGNLIGCDVTGTNALGNGSGIVLVDASFNQIGGTNGRPGTSSWRTTRAVLRSRALPAAT